MNTPRFHRFSWLLKGLLLITVGMMGVGCQKRCQEANSTPFTSLTETPWRLVETDDPNVRFDVYTFPKIQFNITADGIVSSVIQNKEYQTNLMFLWNADAGGNLSMTYKTVPQEDSSATDSSAPKTVPPPIEIGNYTYDLGAELHMYRTDPGKEYYYRWVPYKGVVDPDNACTF